MPRALLATVLVMFAYDTQQHQPPTAILSAEASPVPEPTTFVIWSMLGAIGVTVGWRRRHKLT